MLIKILITTIAVVLYTRAMAAKTIFFSHLWKINLAFELRTLAIYRAVAKIKRWILTEVRCKDFRMELILDESYLIALQNKFLHFTFYIKLGYLASSRHIYSAIILILNPFKLRSL